MCFDMNVNFITILHFLYSGESVEENANLVIRLLIRRPECLGPALRGEGPGLFAAIKEAITLSQKISAEKAAKAETEEEDEDYIDIGNATLNFYCVLVDLLGRCAPEASAIAQGKNDCIRARSILRSLVPMKDLEGVLGLRYNLTAPPSGIDISLLIFLSIIACHYYENASCNQHYSQISN